MANPIHLNKADQAEITAAIEQMLVVRNAIQKKFRIDVLETDTISSTAIQKIVEQYDPTFSVNYARNGYDAKNEKGEAESKSARIDGFDRRGVYVEASFNVKANRYPDCRTDKKYTGSYTFHAEGDIEHKRYIFAARRKDTLKVIRIFDVNSKKNVKVINDILKQNRDAWLAAGKKKRDTINITEKDMLEKFSSQTHEIIDGCEVIKC